MTLKLHNSIPKDPYTKQLCTHVIQYQCLFQERGIVEGPWLLPRSDAFFLLYSTGGGYTDTGYSIWAARATNLTGPYTKATQVTPNTITTMLRLGST